MDQGQANLPIFGSVKESYVLLFSFIEANTKAFLVTFAIIFLLGVLHLLFIIYVLSALESGSAAGLGASVVILSVLTFLVAVPLLISGHRFWLLGERSTVRYFTKFTTPRELRYVGYTVLLPIILVGLPVAFFFLLYFFLPTLLVLAPLLIAIPFIYARLLLVFPQTAVDIETGLGIAWDSTEGMTWRIFFIFFLAPIPLYVLSAIMTRLVLLDPEDSLSLLIVAVMVNLLWVLLAAAVSTVVYKFIRDQYPRWEKTPLRLGTLLL